MSRRSQIIISAFAAPCFAFISLNRWASGHPVWAAVWTIVAVMHGFMLVDAIKSTAAQAATETPDA